MSDYPYLGQKTRLLKDFDGAAARIRPVLVSRFGAESTPALVSATRQEFERLLPDMPYLGGKQPFTQFITATAWFLAMYRVLKPRGTSIEEMGQLVYDASRAYLQSYPGFARRLLGYMSFSPRYLSKLKARAAASQQRTYPGDYVFTFIEGDGVNFDYGVDYSECAGCKFLWAKGASELAPYLCAADKLYSDMLGWGLVRTVTLAEGYDRCDFRFKKGGPTRVVLPRSLRDTGLG